MAQGTNDGVLAPQQLIIASAANISSDSPVGTIALSGAKLWVRVNNTASGAVEVITSG